MFRLARSNFPFLFAATFRLCLPLHTMSARSTHTKELPTHFICVKLGDTDITTNYTQFKEEILTAGSIAGLTEKVFTKPQKLHLTFDVMHLKDDIAISEASQLLQQCRANIVVPIKEKHEEIVAAVRGVAVMNNSSAKARILYGKVASEPLQEIADGIVKQYHESGLAKATSGRNRVKLHMTLINIRHHKPRHIDARDLLDKYASYEFGTQHIEEIHLAAIRGNRLTADGFYEIVSSIPV